jgi:hypothetical protein
MPVGKAGIRERDQGACGRLQPLRADAVGRELTAREGKEINDTMDHILPPRSDMTVLGPPLVRPSFPVPGPEVGIRRAMM